MIKLIEKFPYLSLFLCVFIMLGFTIDAVPVSIMEARNFISAREMLTDDNWLLTTMNGDARYEKPPLPTWITACFGYVFGMSNLLALRWPALIMIAIVGITTYKLSMQVLSNTSHSLINGFIVITSFYVIGITIEGTWDIYTHGFMLLALYHLFVMLKSNTISPKNGLLFMLFIAASVLSKGPVSLYVLFLSFVIAYGISFGFRGKRSLYMKCFVLLLLGIGLGASWYIYVRLTDLETFTRIATKETSNWSSYNVRPFYYYWSFFAQSGLWTVPAFISLLYPFLKHKVRYIKGYKFSFYWTIIAVILLSLIPEKKSRYLMPVLIPLAINIGFYIDYLIRKFADTKSKRITIPVYFNFGLIGIIALVLALSGLFLTDYFDEFPTIRFMILSVFMSVISVSIFRALIKKDILKTFYLSISLMVCLGVVALPLIRAQKSEQFKSITELSHKEEPLYSLNYVAPEVIYTYGDKIPVLNSEQLKSNKDTSSFYVMCHQCNTEDFKSFESDFNVEFLGIYDLNMVDKTAKSYNDRLVNRLAYFTRK